MMAMLTIANTVVEDFGARIEGKIKTPHLI
jgi:hypothetical protein